MKMALIKEESEDVKIEETFRVKQEETEEQTAMDVKIVAEVKGKKRMLSMEMKREIIEKYEAGMRLSAIAKEYGRNPSTIGTILKQKEAIKATKPSKGVTILSKRRTHIHEEMERLLLIWVKDHETSGNTISEATICHKAGAIFSDLVTANEEGSSRQPLPEFKASHGWFDRFKKRTGIHSVVRHGDAASSKTRAVEAFVKSFDALTVEEGYIPQQVFNCDETGLFWKRMPRRTYITEEEKKLPGHKPMKDRLTLALCANASGDCKIKPLLVYHSENPRAFKTHKVLKEKLPVLWRSNAKAWVTRQLFTEWVNLCFGPTVKAYLTEKRLPLKCLLVLARAPAHPTGLEDDILVDYSFIKVLYLPPITTSLLQPMDQQVISNFKKLYTKHLFKRCFEITETTNLTLREFWRQHFNVYICIRLIDQAWQEVSRRTLNSSWKKLWPDAVSEQDFEGFTTGTEDDAEEEDDVEEIVTLGRSMGLVVDKEDVNELLEEHKEDLTMDDLKELEAMQVNVVQGQFSTGKEEEEDPVTTAEIKKYLSMFHELEDFIERRHPEKLHTGRVLAQLNEVCLSHFRNILKTRQEQASLDQYFKKRPFVGNEPESERKKPKSGRDEDEEIDV